jgi:hypothetical protein
MTKIRVEEDMSSVALSASDAESFVQNGINFLGI